MHLGTDVLQAWTCIASCWKLGLAAILLFTFEILGPFDLDLEDSILDF